MASVKSTIRSLQECGSEVLENASDAIVCLDIEAAECLKWSVGFGSIITSGALGIYVIPEDVDLTGKKVVLVLGKFLYECQKQIKFLSSMSNLKALHIYSLYSDSENLEQQFGFEMFQQKCKDLARIAGVTELKCRINQLFVSRGGPRSLLMQGPSGFHYRFTHLVPSLTSILSRGPLPQSGTLYFNALG